MIERLVVQDAMSFEIIETYWNVNFVFNYISLLIRATK